MKAWTLKQLKDQMAIDLRSCHTDLERSMCETICKQEMRSLAAEQRKIRKLTPGEEAILESL